MNYNDKTETIDDLQVNNLKIIQKTQGFRFGIDAVLLANFVSIKKNDVIVDLCSGSGIIPIILAGKRNANKVIGIEIQEEYAEMASRSVCLNNLQDKVTIKQGDLKDKSILPYEFCDIVTCNPPYKEAKGGLISPNDATAIARHEILCDLNDVIASSARILKYSGKLCLIHRPERLAEIFETMKKYNIEPKKVCMVCPSADKAPTMVLIEGIKGAKEKILWMPSIFVLDENGHYTKQINEIYGRDTKTRG